MAKTSIPGTENIPIGRPPRRKSEAWWVLSQQAKAKLKEMRAAGLFGGTPGKAPYYYSQEEGNPKAEIEPRHYIERALDMWRAEIPKIVNEWLRS